MRLRVNRKAILASNSNCAASFQQPTEDENDKKKREPVRHLVCSILIRKTPKFNATNSLVAAVILYFVKHYAISIRGRLFNNDSNTQNVTLRNLSYDFSIILPFRQNDDLKQRRQGFREPAPLSAEAAIQMKVKNYGDLANLRLFKYGDDEVPHRSIYKDEREDWTAEDMHYWDPVTETFVEELNDTNDYYYNFDDDVARNPLIAYDDDTIQNEKHCRRTAWHRNLLINCNVLHEFDVQQGFRDSDTSFLGNGYYREAYLSDPTEGDKVIFKAFKWNSNFKLADFEYMRIDALVAEIFTASPRIVGIYGFCGTGMINEPVTHDKLENIAIPYHNGEDIVSMVELFAKDDEVAVLNHLSGTEKLEYALGMAEAIALLHSYPGGVIVHDDVTLEQFLVDDEGNLKLNDFNRAEFMLWNDVDHDYCRYKNNPGRGEWRSPEEYFDKPLNEQIDIWSLGNNFFALLTGLGPLYGIDNRIELIQKGDTAYIDPRFHNRSFGESILAEIIPLCWKYDPDDRIDIFELVRRLRKAVEENRKNRFSLRTARSP